MGLSPAPSRSLERTDYVCVIVGTGPAGLAAAVELLKRGVPGPDVLMVDLGPGVDARLASRDAGEDRFNTHGFGGAGLFSDGKLCVPDEDATLFPEIPTLLGTGDAVPNPHVGEDEAKRLYRYAFDLFRQLDVDIRAPRRDEDGIDDLRSRFSQWGVFFEYYHVYQVEATDLPVAINRLKSRLVEAGVRILTSTRAVDVTSRDRPSLTIECVNGTHSATISCDALVLAVGKIGTSWLEDQAARLGLKREPRPIELGVRVEVPRSILDPFTAVHRDLKLFRRSGERSLTKTFCTCAGGTVVACRYPELDDAVVLGGYTSANPTANSNFALMTKFDLPGVAALEYAFSVVHTANLIGRGLPTAQRLGDLRSCRPTRREAMAANRVPTTLTEYTLADVNLALPRFIIEATLNTLTEFDRVIPGINADDTIVSAPCLEYCYRRFEVSRQMETSHRAIYVVGDVTGYAKGIIAAAAGGILAGSDIAARVDRGAPV